jgi:hypothetical protein
MKRRFFNIEAFLVLLALALVSVFAVNSLNVKIGKNEAISVPNLDTRELYCGISVTRPQINALVSLPVQISGYVNGCGWEPYLGYVARLKILDSENKQVGRNYLVSRSGSALSPVSSQFSLTIDSLPTESGRASFVFESFGLERKTFVLPVTFTQIPDDVLNNKDEN